MKLFLVRHGQTRENLKKIYMGHRPGHLSALGVKQAKLLGKKLANLKFDIIYSSDLRRSTDTLKEIRKYRPKSPIIYSADLRETNFGELQGKRWDINPIKDLPGTFLSRKAKNGESLREIKKRVGKFLNVLRKKHGKDSVLIITHGGVIQTILSLLLNKPLEEIFKTTTIPNASICEIDVNVKSAKVIKIDSIKNSKIKDLYEQ